MCKKNPVFLLGSESADIKFIGHPLIFLAIASVQTTNSFAFRLIWSL
jgi:hypothetical protein